MDDKINQITGQIIRRLPGGRDHYRLDELRGMELPGFLVERIGVELNRNLRQSLDFPRTKWARMESSEVQEKWEEFVGVARKMASLPADEMRPVIRTSVEECLKILVRPRRNIPEILYGSDRQLPYGEVIQRLESVVVYPHFAKLLPRYMQKKEIRMLERERCEQIIRASDAKMTERYGTQEWAALLQPLFELMNGSVDADLLRLFFEDKGMTATAARFSEVDGTLNRPMLIRILSAPDDLDQIAEELDQAGPAVAAPSEKAQLQEQAPIPDVDRMAEDDSMPEKDSRQEDEPEESDFSAEWNRSMQERWPGDSRYEEPVQSDVDPAERREPEESSADPEGNVSEEEQPGLDSNGHGDEPQETPMWMRFMSPEQRAELEREEELRKEGQEDADHIFGIPEEPAAEQREVDTPVAPQPEKPAAQPRPKPDRQTDRPTGPQLDRDPEPAALKKDPDPVRAKREPSTPEQRKEAVNDTGTDEEAYREELMALQRVMSDERETFIADLFSDSEEDYSKALKDIARMDDWRSVSRYMQNNIFQQNLVEMYSEAAVEYTDRLQAFFLKKQH